VPDHDALNRGFNRLTPQALRAVNDLVIEAAMWAPVPNFAMGDDRGLPVVERAAAGEGHPGVEPGDCREHSRIIQRHRFNDGRTCGFISDAVRQPPERITYPQAQDHLKGIARFAGADVIDFLLRRDWVLVCVMFSKKLTDVHQFSPS